MSKVRSGTSIASLAGEDFGPYRLIRRLGVGGMAETYQAIRRGPSGFAQHVCLKLVLPFFRDNADFVELFEREARLAATLRHSNIVGVIDFGSIEGVPYMALELVDGVDLRVLLDGQDGTRLAPPLVALIGSEIAAALEHAHAPSRSGSDAGKTIIHRDVSPSNVLISRRGEVFLSDFGVAKAISGTSRKQSAVKGKVPYMSPEQLRAQPLDARADLFALGVVMFEALGGRRPYDGPHDPATIMLTLEGNHPSLPGLAPDAPRELCNVIERMIRPERDERPLDATEVIDLLDEFVPSPRARRQLGLMVDECNPPVSAGDAVEPARESTESGAGDTALKLTTGVQRTGDVVPGKATRALGSERQSAGQSKPDAPRWFVWAAVFAVAAFGLGAYLLQPPAEPTPVADEVSPESATDGAPASPEAKQAAVPELEPNSQMGEPRPDPPAEVESQPTRTEAVSAKRQSKAPLPSRLTVIVFPWGNVWIDGKLKGPAPLKNEPIKPGRYKVSVGQDAPFKSQTIRLKPGQRRMLEFDLTK